MNIEKVITALLREARTMVREGEQVEALTYVTRRLSDSGGGSYVTAFNLSGAQADEVIAGEVAYFGGLGRSFEWKAFSFDSPPDLVHRLRSAGFSIGTREAIVVYDLADGLEPFNATYPCEVRRIRGTEELADFRFVAESVFEKNYDATTNELAEAIQTGRKGHDGYIAYIEGEPVSIGRLYTDPASSFAGLYGGGTCPEYRGRGCYRAIVASRARDAVLAGSKYLLVDALPTSQPILERLGFLRIADTWPCSSPNPTT